MYKRSMIKPLKAPTGLNKAEVGNKAWTLNRLSRLGYSVCDGFVLTETFFKRFCVKNGIDRKVTEIKEKIQTSVWDEASRTMLKRVYQSLYPRTGRLIVRSSGIGEDDLTKSCAGIFESVLNIRSFEEMLFAVKRVWCSFFSEAARRYCKKEGGLTAPVIIQIMIPCDKSGVAFTKNPVTGERNLVVEACDGGNDKIIQNKQKADRYIFSSRRPRGNFLLSREQMVKLKLLGERLEQDLGYPCDFEWGFWGGKLYLFQARPIVQKADKAVYTAKPSGSLDCILLDRYASPASVCYLSLLEAWQNQVYLSYYCKTQGIQFDEKPLCFLYNRVYWNMRYQKKYFEDWESSSPVKRMKLFMLVRNGYKSWYRRIPEYDEKIRLYKKQMASANSPTALLQLQEAVIHNFCVFLGVDHFRFLGIAQLLYRKAQKKGVSLDGNVQGIYENKTVQVNRELLRLLEKIRKDRQLYRCFQQGSAEAVLSELNRNYVASDFTQAFRGFLKEHGHRGMGCDDLYGPHWSEAPAKVICLLQNLLKNNITGEKENPTKKQRSKKLAVFTAEYMCLRENQRYYFDKSWVLIREILLKLSDYYLSRKVITHRQDIFHMTIEEIRNGIFYKNYTVNRQVILQRKRNYKAQKKQEPPYMLKDSQTVSVQKKRGRSYKVLGISRGSASGPVKIIRDLEDIQGIKENCICIVKTFHPSWTPILKIAAGLVMCYGNMLSHGAVVAREYQIPVVVFNGDATKIFQDGDVIQLDGSAGRIRFL